jgi:hypothetical protein
MLSLQCNFSTSVASILDAALRISSRRSSLDAPAMANVPVKNNKGIKMKIRLDIHTIATPCDFVDKCAKSLLEFTIRESKRLNSKQS